MKTATQTEKPTRSPVHVVYGGADRYTADTAHKLGSIAVETLRANAANFVEFAVALNLPGSEMFPQVSDAAIKLENQIARNQTKARTENFDAWFAWNVYRKTIAKLEREAVEDFRIDFEDGYGFRIDEEEDRDALRAAGELASAMQTGTITPFSGFRIKSLNKETRMRALRTLDLFLGAFLDKTGNELPANFVVTLPKITDKRQVDELCLRLKKFEKKRKLAANAIGVELMIESPLSLFDRKGNSPLKSFVEATNGRCKSAHFGAFDYTAALGITASDQDLNHPACDFARQMMLANLSPLGIRLSDSVTTTLPIALHKKGRLNKSQLAENRRSIHNGWRVHFENVTGSMRNGFFQSWDLHPNQLPARYAAVYAYFIKNRDSMAARLNQFLAKSTQAIVTGNTFDDAASAEGVMNFFRRSHDCGAFEAKEIKALLGITADQLRNRSFSELSSPQPKT